VARVAGSPFAKPVARAALVAAGLVLLAFIGRAGTAGALGPVMCGRAFGPPASASADPNPVAAPAPSSSVDAATDLHAPAEAAVVAAPLPSAGPAPPRAHGSATPDDPVVLNTATADDLRRLPGIGAKRADAILALRGRIGRFHAVEDLLKVRGIGRATLRRLRPLVRLEPPPPLDAPQVPSAAAR
jgi:competence protein ComEA